MKKKVLFICTHNSARSHMAEGILRHLYGDRFEAYSAGTTATEVRPQAAQVMGEIGIDLSSHRSKSVNEFLGRDIDYVVTVCDQARETCPFFPGGKEYIHQGFADPSTLTGPEEDVLAGYRRVRDEIKDWVEKTFRNK
ncbi:MAG: arsenate reductase ArsC [Firmicutes bacterium]|nr:arsenate reductase ArsC [Bacillota bacterium]